VGAIAGYGEPTIRRSSPGRAILKMAHLLAGDTQGPAVIGVSAR